MLNFLQVHKIDIQALMAKMSIQEIKERLVEIILEYAKQSEAKPKLAELQRGLTIIPLSGTYVSFHSTFFRSAVKPIGSFFIHHMVKSLISPQ